jgi:hypothetical protein
MTAPVVLPAASEIEVRLVPATLLETLAEHYSDENRHWAWFGILAGGLVGMVGGLALLPSGSEVPPAGWAVLGAMVSMSAFVLRELRRVHKRIQSVRAKLFPPRAPVAASSGGG